MATTFGSLLLDAAKKSGLVARANEAKQSAGNTAYGAAQKGIGVAGSPGTYGKSVTSAIGMASGAPMMGLAKHLPGMSKATQALGKLAHPTQLLGLPKKLLSKGMGIMGISMSVSTLLRQSQIFTGILGALFQILGGFVDIILAPFMPMFIKVVRKLAEQIPKVREYAQKLYEWLDANVFPHIKAAATWVWDKVSGIVDFLSTKGPNALSAFSTFKDFITSTVKAAWGYIQEYFAWWKENIFPEILALGKEAWHVLKGILIYAEDKIREIVPHIVSIASQLVDILINNIMKPMYEALKPILAWYADMVITQWSWMIRIIDTKLLPFIQDALDIVMPAVKEISDKFMETVAPAFEELMASFRPMVEAILDKLTPLILWALPYVMTALKWALGVVFEGLATFFKVVAAIFRGITWLLSLPDFGAFMRNLPGMILGAIIGGIGKLFGMLSNQKLDLPWAPDIDLGFLSGLAGRMEQMGHDLKAPLLAATSQPRLDAQGQPINLTINNMSGAIIDTQTKEVVAMNKMANGIRILENNINSSGGTNIQDMID
jgi:hypothetical protein